jgi:hypothetical protein
MGYRQLMRLALVGVALISISHPAAGQQTSIDLQMKCSSREKNVDALICQIYFNAFTETLLVTRAGEPNGICLPPGASANQNRLVVEKYMSEHPEKLHEYAAILIVDALREAFPCRRN